MSKTNATMENESKSDADKSFDIVQDSTTASMSEIECDSELDSIKYQTDSDSEYVPDNNEVESDTDSEGASIPSEFRNPTPSPGFVAVSNTVSNECGPSESAAAALKMIKANIITEIQSVDVIALYNDFMHNTSKYEKYIFDFVELNDITMRKDEKKDILEKVTEQVLEQRKEYKNVFKFYEDILANITDVVNSVAQKKNSYKENADVNNNETKTDVSDDTNEETDTASEGAIGDSEDEI